MQQDEKLRITPRARRIAKEFGIDPASPAIVGTGFLGGICENDITGAVGKVVRATPLARAMAKKSGKDIYAVKGTGPFGKIVSSDIVAAETNARAAGDASKKIRSTIPYAGVRKTIGGRMAASKFTAPHLYFTQRVDLGELLSLRTRINQGRERKISITDYIARAVVLSLIRYPEMNASLVDNVIEQYESINLGIAVAAPGGLIVPVVKDAQNLNVIQLSDQANALLEKARSGKLLPNEYTGGTFTISNLGMFGIENFTAIINPPESGILAVSSMKDEVVVVKSDSGGKAIEIRPIMNITLTVDHRLIDGLLAARVVTEIKKILEHPDALND